jgi:signal transduction histidine kinase
MDTALLIAQITHRLGNNLGLVRSYINDIRDESSGLLVTHPSIEDNLKRIENAVQSALDFSMMLSENTITPETITSIDLWDAIQAALRRVFIPDSVKVVATRGNNIPPVIATDNIIRVFENLISNAIEAMPDGGNLDIGIAVSENQTAVEVSIKDSGEGIPNDIQERIFKTFVKTKPHGQGIGLWLCKLYLDQCGGTIMLSSQPNKGTVIKITMPIQNLG